MYLNYNCTCMTGATNGAGLPTLPEHLRSPQVFSGVRATQYLVFGVMFCISLFVLQSFFFWPLYCLSFDLGFWLPLSAYLLRVIPEMRRERRIEQTYLYSYTILDKGSNLLKPPMFNDISICSFSQENLFDEIRYRH